MLNFNHTYLYFKDLIRTYFCVIYVILWDLIGNKRQVFQSLNPWPDCSGNRPDSRPHQEPVDRHGRQICTRRAQRPAHLAGRPRGRSTESTPLSGGSRSTARSTAGTTVRKVTVGRSTDRSTGRAKLPFLAANR